jgi:hypothetical protein
MISRQFHAKAAVEVCSSMRCVRAKLPWWCSMLLLLLAAQRRDDMLRMKLVILFCFVMG